MFSGNMSNVPELNKPDVRLVWSTRTAHSVMLEAPTVRLVVSTGPVTRLANKTLEKRPVERLVVQGDAQDGNGSMYEQPEKEELRPALLVSYYYLTGFLKRQSRYVYRDWVMDSGAFSAHKSGVSINLNDYMDTCKRLRDTDPTLSEVYALDVIGDHKASLRNTEIMWKAGIEAIPCFHYGSPWDVLVGLAKDYPKIALGGVAASSTKRKLTWAKQCFARVWPKKIHGFAFCGRESLMALPWHSVDSSTWEIGPCAFGRWPQWGNVSVRGSNQNLRGVIKWYLDLEQAARVRWAKTWEGFQ